MDGLTPNFMKCYLNKQFINSKGGFYNAGNKKEDNAIYSHALFKEIG
jgi:hypothetical protein